ncbi:hybrid sensor histidine kinase/response regulator [Beggiatoa leptomitoformis]|uniref:histidine kinase n=1 Tax=Beggiatoa leptomitoformis TaxID=288004 RepID=A0A2N9YC14_9GAMM|nr:hybrid sensor histidine kinase/response regulator [Beggiatoa leptomitoformis]AUI68008.1 response regulator [Beggiatoa leptomitoformis]QGX03471.1 response regulator [Beggiatoa leptomitoformis]
MVADNGVRATLLIVDDTSENIHVLFDFLQATNKFDILVAEDGESALESVQETKPDLILLDVMMPKMDGFETCRRLKNNPETVDIPIIFITALSDLPDKVHGFFLGAVDYITKPFQQEEVLARINTHITIQQLRAKLAIQNEHLMYLNQEKNELLGIAAHDLKNPLFAIQTLTDKLRTDFHKLSVDKTMYYLDTINIGTKQMFDIISNLLDVNAIESGQHLICMQEVDVLPIVIKIIDNYKERADNKRLTIDFNVQETSYWAMVDKNALNQVLDNLLSNAVKYSPLGKLIRIHLFQRNKQICCEIQDQGQGIDEEDQQILFRKFSRLKPRPTAQETSNGLGLFIVKKLMELMNGDVWCQSTVGIGSIFGIAFQACHAKNEQTAVRKVDQPLCNEARW